MPFFAASDIAPITATGMPISSGHGVATTITARNLPASPLHAQAAPANANANGVYQAPSRSASRRIAG